MENLSLIQTICVWALPVLFAITIHEVAHGWVASKLGDKTALIMGRITLNPFKHLDLFGTIIVPGLLLLFGGFIFGWAKPVPVNYRNLKNPRRDMALVALAGPVTNLLMALIWAAIGKGGAMIFAKEFTWALAIVYMGHAGILINVTLMVLNLLPIPPLDGSKVLTSILPGRIAIRLLLLEPFGFFLLLILLATGLLSRVISPLIYFFFDLLRAIFNY